MVNVIGWGGLVMRVPSSVGVGARVAMGVKSGVAGAAVSIVTSAVTGRG